MAYEATTAPQSLSRRSMIRTLGSAPLAATAVSLIGNTVLAAAAAPAAMDFPAASTLDVELSKLFLQWHWLGWGPPPCWTTCARTAIPETLTTNSLMALAAEFETRQAIGSPCR